MYPFGEKYSLNIESYVSGIYILISLLDKKYLFLYPVIFCDFEITILFFISKLLFSLISSSLKYIKLFSKLLFSISDS